MPVATLVVGTTRLTVPRDRNGKSDLLALARRVVKVGERRSNILRFPGGTYTIVGATLTAPFRVRERMVVYVNDQKVFEDPIGRADGDHPQVSFEASSGDTLKIDIFSEGVYGGMGRANLKQPYRGVIGLFADDSLDFVTATDTRRAVSRTWELKQNAP